jgi:hypothetical protein
MAAPTTSDQWDEFLLTCKLFSLYESNGGFFKVNVPDVSHLESSERDAKQTLRKLRAMADNLTFMNSAYNAAKMPTFANRSDLLIFTTPEFKAAIDVEALAPTFNVGLADMHGRIIPIPAENFGIDGAQALMTTKDFFVIADSLFETTNSWNPVGLHNNYFLHHHQIISASRFVPSILFTTKGGDEVIVVNHAVTGISAITVKNRDGKEVTDVTRGEVYEFSATATTEGPETSVRWSVAGATAPQTYITSSGVLHVSGIEGADKLTVTATTTWLDEDNLMRDGHTATKVVTVSGEARPNWPVSGVVTDITIKGTPVPGFDPNTYSYTMELAGDIVAKDVKVSGVDAGDVDVTIAKADGVTTVTIEAASAPGDPVYTVTVTVPAV